MKMECSCEEFKKWDEFEMGIYSLAYSHGILYPKDGPIFKYCAFCGKRLIDKEKKEK